MICLLIKINISLEIDLLRLSNLDSDIVSEISQKMLGLIHSLIKLLLKSQNKIIYNYKLIILFAKYLW